jgi:hypothetical protein
MQVQVQMAGTRQHCSVRSVTCEAVDSLYAANVHNVCMPEHAFMLAGSPAANLHLTPYQQFKGRLPAMTSF